MTMTATLELLRRGVHGFAAGVLVLAVACSGQAQDHWWCGGDGYQSTGLASERNTLVSDARTYDDFDVPVKSTVRGGWGNFLLRDVMPARAYYEIRSGLAVGDGGTLHAAGEMDVEVAATGRVTIGIAEYLVRGQFAEAVTLEPGRYWITIAPIGQGTGRCFLSDTRGRDELPGSDPTPPPMGMPRNNHNSFFDSPFFNCKFCDTRSQLGNGTWDFAIGIGPSTGPPVFIRPDSFEVIYGEYVDGELDDLFEDDHRYVTIRQKLSARISAPNAGLLVEGRLPFAMPGYLGLQFRACVTAVPRDNVTQRVELFDFSAASWVTVDEGPGHKYQCGRATPVITVDTYRFVEPLTGRLRAALTWFDRGTATLNWTAYTDQTLWVTEPQ